MTKKQLISWQAAYGLEQDLMSPESYLEYETPTKSMWSSESPSLQFSICSYYCYFCYHSAQKPPRGASTKESCFQELLPERLFPKAKTDEKAVCSHTYPQPSFEKEKSNNTTVKAEFLVKEKRILNLIEKYFGPCPESLLRPMFIILCF